MQQNEKITLNQKLDPRHLKGKTLQPMQHFDGFLRRDVLISLVWVRMNPMDVFIWVIERNKSMTWAWPWTLINVFNCLVFRCLHLRLFGVMDHPLPPFMPPPPPTLSATPRAKLSFPIAQAGHIHLRNASDTIYQNKNYRDSLSLANQLRALDSRWAQWVPSYYKITNN